MEEKLFLFLDFRDRCHSFYRQRVFFSIALANCRRENRSEYARMILNTKTMIL